MYSLQGVDLKLFVVACLVIGMVGRWVLMGELPVIWVAFKALVGRRGEKDMYSFRDGDLFRLVLEGILLGTVASWLVIDGLPLLWEVVKGGA